MKNEIIKFIRLYKYKHKYKKQIKISLDVDMINELEKLEKEYKTTKSILLAFAYTKLQELESLKYS